MIGASIFSGSIEWGVTFKVDVASGTSGGCPGTASVVYGSTANDG